MIDPTYGWLVNAVPDMLSRFDALFLARKRNDTEYELIVGFGEDGHAVLEVVNDSELSEFQGFRLPRGLLTAIAEHVKPGASTAEVARLEEALKVERGRVDTLLARISGMRP